MTTWQSEVSAGPDWTRWPARSLAPAAATTVADHDGAHRVIGPDQTWSAVEPMLDTAGITRVADLTWLDDLGIPTVQAVRPASLTLSVSQGKGLSYAAAKVSAVMESIESWHAENLSPDLPGVTPRDLAGELTYDPARLERPAGSLYHRRAKLDWMGATTLCSGTASWVPWASVAVNVAVRDCWGPPMFAMSTNGLAAGNTYDEAALHALYELMERHALWAAVAGSSLFDVSDTDAASSTCGGLVEQIRAAGSQLRIARVDVWDGYYCFAAELTSRGTEVVFSGSGLHHDPNVALARAITEAAQSRLTAISGAREDLQPALYQRFARMHAFGAARRSVTDAPAATPTPWHTARSTSLPELLADAAAAVRDRTGTEPLAVVCDFDRACVPTVHVIAPDLATSSTSPMRVSLEDQA